MLESANALPQLSASAGGADDLQGDEHSRQEVLKALELLGSPGPVEEVCSRQGPRDYQALAERLLAIPAPSAADCRAAISRGY